VPYRLMLLSRTVLPTAVVHCVHRQIWYHFSNIAWRMWYAGWEKYKTFFAEQEQWTRSMIKKHSSSENEFWRHVEYIMAQFDGLYDGYIAAAEPEWVTNT